MPTIDALSAVAALTGSEELPVWQGGATFKSTSGDIASVYLVNARAPQFGATGNGVTDDTAAIQAAIDHAYAQNHQGVRLPAGQYKISSPLYLDAPGNLRPFPFTGSIAGTSLIVTIPPTPAAAVFKVGTAIAGSGVTAGTSVSSIFGAVASSTSFTRGFGVVSVTSGLKYWETVVNGTALSISIGNIAVGIGNTSSVTTLGQYLGVDSDTIGVFPSGVYNNGGAVGGINPGYAAGARICHALDLTNNLYYFRVGATGNWNNSPSANPATQTGGISIPSAVFAHPVVPAFSLWDTADSVVGFFSSGSWVGSAPAGFSAFAGTQTWNPSQTNAFAVLSGGNLTATILATAILNNSQTVGGEVLTGSNFAAPPVFSFSLALVGDDGLSDTGYGTTINTTFESAAALYVGPGQGMRVSGLTIHNASGSGNYRMQLGGVGIGLTGCGGGSSRVLIENSGVVGFGTGFRTSANGNGTLGDSNTFSKCIAALCGFGFTINGTQNFINAFYDCNTSSCNTSIQANQGTGAIVKGGNHSSESAVASSFGISSISTITSALVSGHYIYSFTAAVASPDTYLTTGIYTAFTIATAHFGVVPLVMTNFNVGTGVASFSILTAWSDYFYPGGLWANSIVSNTDLQAEVQAVTKVYAAELCAVFIGSGLSIDGIHIENGNAPTTFVNAQENVNTDRSNDVSNCYFNYDPSLSAFRPSNSPTDANLAKYYAQTQFPFIWIQNVATKFRSCAFSAVTDPLLIDITEGTMNNYDRNFTFENCTRMFIANVRSGQNGGFTDGYNAFGSSPNLGSGWYDQSPFSSLGPTSKSDGDYWRDFAWGIAPQWGFRPAPWAIPIITPGQLSVLQGTLPAITGTAKNYTIGYPLIWGGQAYQTGDWSISTTHPVIQTVVTGGSGAGSIVLTGAVVGDVVQGVTNLTTPGDVSADFETIIGVAGHVQQLSANLTGAALLTIVKSPKIFVSNHQFYTYGQNLTTSNVPSLSWSYKGQSFCVTVNDQSLLFPGLGITLNDGSSDVPYIVTGNYPGLGYVTTARADSATSMARLSGTKTSVITGTVIKQQPFSFSYP
jgi:hypothetical protein